MCSNQVWLAKWAACQWSALKARLEGYAGGSLISTGGHSLQRLLLVLDELAG